MQDRDEPALRRRGDWTVVVILAILGAAIFAAGVVVGISLDGQDPDKLGLEVAKALMTLGSGLILGGAVKAVLDRFQEAARDRAEEEVRQAHQFDEEQSRHERLLADLRGVHDSAESVRLMVAAHRSAKAYGEHMRALIGCQVLLLKVKRTLDVSQEHGAGGGPNQCLIKMLSYLRALQDEYRDGYKNVSDCQRYDEVVTTQRFNKAAEREIAAEPEAANRPPPHSSQRAWELLGDPALFPVLDDLTHQGPQFQQRFLAPFHQLAAELIGSGGLPNADAEFDTKVDGLARTIRSEAALGIPDRT